MWNRDIQAGVTIVVDRSLRHLPCVTTEEVLEGTHGCGIAGSGTARGRFDISRASDQDFGSKESRHKAQDNQVLQDPETMRLKKQHGKARICSVLAIRISSYHSEGACDCSLSF
jgi:hypothetical protein